MTNFTKKALIVKKTLTTSFFFSLALLSLGGQLNASSVCPNPTVDESKIEQQVIKAFHDKTSPEELKNLIDNKKGSVYIPLINEGALLK